MDQDDLSFVNKSKEPALPSLNNNKKNNLASVIDIDRFPDRMIAAYRHIVRSPNVSTEKLKHYLTLVVKGLHYSIKCLKPPSLQYISFKRIKLNEKKEGNLSAYQGDTRKILYLDLDETVVYQCKETERADHEISLDDGQKVIFSLD